MIKRLKLSQAVGIDVISNEMLKVGFPYLKECLLKLFSLTVEANIVPSDWCMGLISPVFKSDDKLNPDNYRGICVISWLSKLFLLILNDRPSYFLNTHDIISKSQIGFQKNNRSTYHIFTLKTIRNKHVHHTPTGKVYACFVDLKKAYDSVWHDGLFAKLASINVSGSFLNILVKLYQKSSNAVKMNGFRTNFFSCGRGVRKGCPLSLNLFNIYVNELPQLLNKVNDSPIFFQMEQKQVASRD